MAQTDYVVKLRGDDKLSPIIKNLHKNLTDTGTAATKLEDIKKKFNDIKSSGAPLSRCIRDVKKQMELLTRSQEINTVEGRRMYSELSAAAKSYDAMLKRIREDTDSTKGKFDLKGIVTKAAGTVGLGGAASMAMGALSNPYVLAAGAIAGAGKALFDYNAELDRSLQKTAQFTGLSGDALMNLRNGIKSVADTFGKDYDTTLSAVDGLMVQFGISGEEALRIIRDGFVGGADESGRMLDLISQYSASFHDAGISADELVAIIGNTRNGIFSEQGMQLIQMAAKKIREMGPQTAAAIDAIGLSADKMMSDISSGSLSTMGAIQMISSKLKDLSPQSQEVGMVFKDVFGRQGAAGGYELITALADVETNLEAVKGQTGEWGAAMEELQEADREMQNALSTLFGISDSGFSTMTTRLKADVYGAVAKVINGFIDWYNKSTLVRFAINDIGLAFENAWEIIKAILEVFGNALGAVAEMIEGIFDRDWDKVKNSWKNGLMNILSTVSTAFENIKENTADAIEETLHGQIKPLQLEAEVTPVVKGTGKGGNVGGGGVGGGDESGKTSKAPKEKEKEVFEEGSIKYARQMVSDLRDQWERAATEGERAAIKESLDKWEEELDRMLGKSKKVTVEPVIDPGSLTDLQNQLQEVTKQLNATTDPTKADELKTKYAELTEQIKAMRIELGYEKGADPIDERQQQLEEYQRKVDTTCGAVGTLGGAFSQLGGAIEGTAGEMMKFAGQSVQSIASVLPEIIKLITVKEGEAIAGAAASGAGIGFPQNLAAIAAGVAAVMSIFASIPKFEDGGIVGGASFHGDRILSRLNSGEGVLTREGMQNLHRIFSEGSFGGPQVLVGRVDLRLKGKDAVGVMNNYNSKIITQS